MIALQTPYTCLQLIVGKLSTKWWKEQQKKQQQQINQLSDMISTLTFLISFHNQQQQVTNSSAHKTPHSGVGAIANVGDNTPSSEVAPVNQMKSQRPY